MAKWIGYFFSLVEWMGSYRTWYKNEYGDVTTKGDGDPKHPPPPPPPPWPI